MARVRKSGDGRTVRLSIVMQADDHKRLAALALARDTTIQGVVLDLVLPALTAVRVPWIVGTLRPAEPEGPAERAAG